MDEFVLSEEEIKFLEESSAELSMDAVEKHTEAKLAAINDTETWLKENADNIEKYKELIMSEEFRSSPAFGIKEKLKAYMENSGYYKIAIPLLRKMSPAYDEYYLRLLSADGKFRNARENTDQNI